MEIYLSSPSDSVMDEIMQRCPGLRLNVLITRARMPGRIETFFHRYGGLINKAALDCGAFSLNSSNLNLTEKQLFAQFATYAKSNAYRFAMMFSYDANFESNGFEENQSYLMELENLGIPVVPVIHNMKNFEINFFITAGYSSVAIGKQKNKTNPSVLIPAVNKLYSSGVKVHLFGITDFDLIVACPAFSCDSKSWLNDSITGVVRFWNPAKDAFNKTDIIYFPDKMMKKKRGTIHYNDYEYIDEFKKLIESVGFSIKDLLGSKQAHNRAVLGMLYYKTIEDVVTSFHLNNPLFYGIL